jgi:tRNA-splicing ligase RtcB (3'-phosphate/5'-hydroxy nucleic acid ligase)
LAGIVIKELKSFFMKLIIKSEKLPIKMWLDDIEEGALKQAKNLANLPFGFKHVAIMPDAHQGYGMPIGGVLATKNAIIPNAVGVDIGCGMCAVKTSLEDIERETLKDIISKIRREIPVGFKWHKKPQDETRMPQLQNKKLMPIVYQEYKKAIKQLGTLGGGNHFIEIQKGSDGFIWIMIHSGSRNIGKQVADHYNKLAVKLSEKFSHNIPKNWQLAFFPIDTKEAKQYLSEMEYCVNFAFANRKLMMDNVKFIFTNIFKEIKYTLTINIAHNYAASENHFKQNVIVHRKGATRAFYGELGIIPGSQGAKSYIVKGKGNPESFMSCSHGAGRKLGRKQAIRELDLEKEKKLLDKKGIIHSIKKLKDLDEAPSAYKDIDTVMKNQKDLVDIAVALTPLAVIKG